MKILIKDNIEIFIDKEDYEFFLQHRWYAKESTPSLFYLVRNSDLKRFHRLILNAKPGQIVDHINGNSLDNRKCNLRITTQAINITNGRIRKNNKSGIQGVSFSKRLNKFRAYLNVGKNHYCKWFSNVKDAITYRKFLECTYVSVELPAQTIKQRKVRENARS